VLGLPGTPEVLEIDTSYFVGNAPAAIRVHGLRTGQQAESWIEILPETAVQPDTPHRWLLSLQEEIAALRIDAIPDGGIARVRLWGSISPDTRERARLRWAQTPPG
jgi:allantoicase